MFFHRFGSTVIIPRAIIIPPEKPFQKLAGISIRSVDALSKREKRMIEILSEVMITTGIFLLFPSSALAPSIIGRSGSTQGANTVRTPDRNAITKRVIFLL